LTPFGPTVAPNGALAPEVNPVLCVDVVTLISRLQRLA